MDSHDLKRSLQRQKTSSDSFSLEKQLRIIQANGHEVLALVTENGGKVEREPLDLTYRASSGSHVPRFFFLS